MPIVESSGLHKDANEIHQAHTPFDATQYHTNKLQRVRISQVVAGDVIHSGHRPATGWNWVYQDAYYWQKWSRQLSLWKVEISKIDPTHAQLKPHKNMPVCFPETQITGMLMRWTWLDEHHRTYTLTEMSEHTHMVRENSRRREAREANLTWPFLGIPQPANWTPYG